MSYTLKPADETARENAAAAYVTQPISVQRVGIGVGIGAVILFSLAGLPSWSRHRPPRPPLRATDGLYHGSSPAGAAWIGDVERTYADLMDVVDPVTHQRPAYPSTAELFARLLPLPHWQHAALFESDVSVEELQAVELGDRRQCETLVHRDTRRMPSDVSMSVHWQLALMDDAGRILARVFIVVPTLDSSRCGDGDEAAFATCPELEKRFPDWPRVAVFNRPPAEAQSEG